MEEHKKTRLAILTAALTIIWAILATATENYIIAITFFILSSIWAIILGYLTLK